MVTVERVNTNKSDKPETEPASTGIFRKREKIIISRQEAPGFCLIHQELQNMQTISNVGVSTREQSVRSGL